MKTLTTILLLALCGCSSPKPIPIQEPIYNFAMHSEIKTHDFYEPNSDVIKAHDELMKDIGRLPDLKAIAIKNGKVELYNVLVLMTNNRKESDLELMYQDWQNRFDPDYKPKSIVNKIRYENINSDTASL